METQVLKKAYCGTATNRIVTLEKDKSTKDEQYFVLIQKDFHSAEIFLNREKAFQCYNGIVEQMELTSVDESMFNIQD